VADKEVSGRGKVVAEPQTFFLPASAFYDLLIISHLLFIIFCFLRFHLLCSIWNLLLPFIIHLRSSIFYSLASFFYFLSSCIIHLGSSMSYLLSSICYLLSSISFICYLLSSIFYLLSSIFYILWPNSMNSQLCFELSRARFMLKGLNASLVRDLAGCE
jgi:hypothetical protein